jgi:hypothetical protein
MKITARFLVVLACAWCALPLLHYLTQPHSRVLEFVPVLLDASRVVLILVGWGAWSRRAWTAGVALVLALLSTLVTLVVFHLAPEVRATLVQAVQQISLSRHQNYELDMVVEGLTGQSLALVAWIWAIAIVSFRVKRVAVSREDVSRSFSERSAGENRLIRNGLLAMLAWLFIVPPVLNLVRPLREVRHGTWTSDAAHARYALTSAQREALSPGALAVVADLDVDLSRIAAGGEPVRLQAKPGPVTDSVMYIDSSAYAVTAYRLHGKLTQMDVWFYVPELRTQLGPARVILLR